MDKKSRELVMAKLYFKNKDFKMAEKSLIDYLSMSSDDAAALKLLAQVYEQTKRFDKAFETYERCYLTEPERTGVLLDICRILLMSEAWLEHVDYRKWLDLTMKAFPSNPIVVNLRAFLSTMPAKTPPSLSPQRELNNQPAMAQPARNSIAEDSLRLILDKLTKVEDRMSGIEKKLSELSLNAPSQLPAPQPTRVELPRPATPKSDPPKQITPRQETPKQELPKPETPKQDTPKQELFRHETPRQETPRQETPRHETPRQEPPALPTGSIFGLSTASQPYKSTFSYSGASGFNLNSPSTLNAGLNLPKPENNSSAPWSGFNFSKPAESNTNSSWFSSSLSKPADLSSPGLAWGTNTSLFKPAEVAPNSIFGTGFGSLSKPTENSSSANVGAGDDDADDNGLVPNQELPIAQTCQMKPIEVKTGEEDEDVLFEKRAKLFRLNRCKDNDTDPESLVYKDRGIGNIKVLKNRISGKGRLVMRRDAVGLVCLNCSSWEKVDLIDKSVRWVGIDLSDGHPESWVFLIRFKDVRDTEKFHSLLKELFSDSIKNTSITSAGSPAKSNPDVSSANVNEDEIQLVDPVLDRSLVDKARKFKLPDLFYHQLKNQDSCKSNSDSD